MLRKKNLFRGLSRTPGLCSDLGTTIEWLLKLPLYRHDDRDILIMLLGRMKTMTRTHQSTGRYHAPQLLSSRVYGLRILARPLRHPYSPS